MWKGVKVRYFNEELRSPTIGRLSLPMRERFRITSKLIFPIVSVLREERLSSTK